MICEEKTVFDVSPDKHELDLFRASAAVIRECIDLLEKKECDRFVYGYPECPGYAYLKDLKLVYSTLINMTVVHSIEKAEE